MDQPLVTIITGFYNRGHILDRTLQSMLNQTYKNLEIIVFDDASQDDTKQRLEKYRALNDPRLTIIVHEKNKGFTPGMIDAIAMSKGKYIAIQGSGDESVLDRIALQVDAMEADPGLSAVGCFYENIIEDIGLVRLREIVADDCTLESLLNGNVFSHSEVMMRKDAYYAAGGYRKEFRYALDYDLWLRLIQQGRFFTVKKMLYKRYVQFDGVSYDPIKFLAQTRYGTLTKRMAKASPAEQERILTQLREQGLDSLISTSEPEIQKKIIRSVLRSAVWGDTEGAANLTSAIENLTLRKTLKLLISVYASALGKPLRLISYRLLGIDKN
ncbi:Glycosyl transferase, family 2 protein [gamma proteobacterium HdN1]|nr:Glycosyl transferase, family 2 protein [gamma proteobacterium HdN1]